MPATYAAVIADLRAAGLKAAGMSYRMTDRPGHDGGRVNTGPGALGRGPADGEPGDAGRRSTGGRSSSLGGFSESQRGGGPPRDGRPTARRWARSMPS